MLLLLVIQKGLNMARFVYADNAATTPVSREVIEAMTPCFEVAWGNPSSLHAKGREAKELLDDARERIAKVFSCFSAFSLHLLYCFGALMSCYYRLFCLFSAHYITASHKQNLTPVHLFDIMKITGTQSNFKISMP